jgi:PAS domain S-box-containing protein
MSIPVQILILEDCSDDVERILCELRREGFVPDWRQISTEAEYVAALQRADQTDAEIDVILSDYEMAQFNVSRALELLQAKRGDIPLIVVAEEVGEENAVACMRLGAADYVLKHQLSRLGAAVNHALQERCLCDEKRRAEKAQRGSEKQYRAIIESSLQGITILQDNRLVFANHAIADILGYTVEELLDLEPEELIDLVHPQDRDLVAGRFRDRLAKKSTPSRYEFRVLDKRGIEHLVDLVSGLVEYDGRPAVQAAVLDITEHKRAEEALASERTVLRTLIDLIPEVVYTKDLEARKTLSNHVDLQYLGAQTEADVLGKTDFDFYPKDMATKFYADDQFVMQTGQSVLNREEVVFRRGNEKRWLLTSKVPLRSESNQIVGLVGIGWDITERKQAEEAQQRYIGRLRALRAIDAVILSGQSARDISQTALCQLQSLIPYDRASITLFDFETDRATILAAQGIGERELGPDAVIPLSKIGGLEELRRAEIVTVADTRRASVLDPLNERLLDLGILASVAVPFMVEGQLIGALNLGAIAASAFTDEHLEIAQESVGQLAIGIQQARLRDQIQRHTKDLERQVATRTAELARQSVQLQVAAEVARDAATAASLDVLLTRAVDLIWERFGFYHAGIFLVDEAGSEKSRYAMLRAATGKAGKKMLERGHKLKVGETGIVGYVTSTGKPRIALDVGADAVHFDNPLLPKTRSEAALPLRVGERVIGVLDVQSAMGEAFDETDVRILQVLADQLAVAIERTRLFEQTRETLEERLRAVISKTPVILFALDREGVFYLSEGQGLAALGLESGELVGRSIFEVFGSTSASAEGVRRALAGEANAAAIEGNGVVFDAWYMPVRESGDEITGVIGVATDVTERECMQEQMHQQERLAVVGQLAGGIAHDFNNFLMTIMLYAHLIIRNGNVPSEVQPFVETIVEEAKRAADLVRQILDFSRRSVIETRPVDLRSFVEDVVDIMRKTLPENIRLITEVGRDDYVVDADPTRIQQAIMNLALNSRDAMPEGGELRISLSEISVPSTGPGLPDSLQLVTGKWVCLSIADTGTGMSEEVYAHLFEPFFTTKGSQGNGLGLAQVYGIVKQHGGDVRVETELGHGTVFQIYLPAYAATERQDLLEEESTVIPEGRGETILFVEDEEKVQDAGRWALQSLGYQVLTASNGKEGLEVFQRTDNVDLVLTDMIMPEMGGREMVQRLKQISPDVKALIITGYTVQEDMQALKESGFADVVYKPFDVSVLGQAIRRIIDAEPGNGHGAKKKQELKSL